jgi:hypothetical protein
MKLNLSDKFVALLKEFEGESLVARMLLNTDECVLVEDCVDYISISDDDSSRISYLSKDRIAKLEAKMMPDEFSERLKNEIMWSSSIRFHVKPGAFVSKVFPSIDPREVEKFSNLYKTNINKPRFNLSIVNGESIRQYYHYDTYADNGRGSLANSCMKHEPCQKYLDIYVQNPDIISMLIMKDDFGKLIGRALLWKTEDHKIMDRIYTINDEVLSFYFRKWATDNGYLYKSEQNWFNTLNFENMRIKKHILRIDLTLNIPKHRYYPYMDTFKWMNMFDNKISNYLPDDIDDVRTLTGSDGSTMYSDHIVLDMIDNVYRYRNECPYVAYLNIHTYQGNLNYSEINEQWILSKDAFYDEYMNDYVFNTSHDHLNNHAKIQERIKLLDDRRERTAERSRMSERLISQYFNTYIDGSTGITG